MMSSFNKTSIETEVYSDGKSNPPPLVSGSDKYFLSG